jgi:hypothetical protein
MHNEVAEYLSKYKNRIDQLYTFPFNEDIPRNEFGFRFFGKTAFKKTLELKEQVSLAARNAGSDEEKERLATYFIKEWGKIAKVSGVREIVTRFNSVAFCEAPCNADFAFKKISSWSKWISIICPKWACIYDARVAYSLNAINYISGAKHNIFPMPDGRNTRINILDVTTLLLNKRLSPTDTSEPKSIKKSHFVGESVAYEKYIELIHNVSPLLWNSSVPCQFTEMLLFSLADTHIYKELFGVVSKNCSLTKSR